MHSNTLDRVVSCIAATTRYPTELLTPDAELENGLGIDSVKRVEIIVALGENFGLDLVTQGAAPSVRTIGDIASWIDGQLTNEVKPEQPAHDGNGKKPPTTESNVASKAIEISASQPLPAPHFSAPADGRESASTSKPLAGRVALITGSGRGIGRTIARLLARRGATVIVNSFHSREQGEQTAAEINAGGGNAVPIWGSVANPDHVDEMFAQIERRFGLDILVCNASDGRIGSFMELTPDDWDRAFRTNVAGHHQCAVHAARLMRPRGGGAIVTMSAVGAHHYVDGLGSQGVAKAAVESLTRYLAGALGPSGIRVNCVAGGPVYGELLAKFPEARVAQGRWESVTPDGELCTPMDLAQTIAFLVSDDARGINGVVWTVDHGFSAMAPGQPQRRLAASQFQDFNMARSMAR